MGTSLALRSLAQRYLHRLLDSIHRGSTGRLRADASDEYSKSNQGCRCRTVCKCDLKLDRQAVHRVTMLRRERRLLPPGSWVLGPVALSQLSSHLRRLDRSLTVWSGFPHTIRHPGRVVDDVNASLKPSSKMTCISITSRL
jgi:hypothetical protein